MNSIVQEGIDEGLAALKRLMSAPTGNLGYGTDMVCGREVDLGSDVDPNSVEALAQSMTRRLDCPRGRLVDDLTYGMDLRAELNKGTTVKDFLALAQRVKNEVSKDDRVVSAKVTVQPLTTDGSSLKITIDVVPADPSLGNFSLTLAVTSAEVLLTALSKAA